MGFGTVGLLGNYLAGRMVDNQPVKATVIFCLLLGVGAAGAIFSVAYMAIFVASLVAWGIAHTALFPLGVTIELTAFPMGIGLRKGNDELRAWTDDWVSTNLKNRKLNDIYKKYFKQDLPKEMLD
ncbi:hypothetical protein ACLMJV_31905 [Sinorhizobium meliloti]|uniref:hypothetical protein n=1 Tax=Rhizobium meliloti TaxID=382 RepID=UPI00398CFDD7